MVSLDDKSYLKIDKDNVISSIDSFPAQVAYTINEFNRLDLKFDDIDNIVISGMGGSILGARAAKSYLNYYLKVPVEITHDYTLPNYVNSKTLVVISSYSGTTEETISSYKDAKAKGAQVCVVTTGGEIKKLSLANNDQAFIFDGINNPSNSPRLGLGYSMTFFFLLLNKFCYPSLLLDESLVTYLNELNNLYGTHIAESQNPAKQLARSMFNKEIAIFSAQHLSGASYTIKNQLNENSKVFSTMFELSELNHHLLEGLASPKSLKLNLKVLFVESENYSSPIQKRISVTKEVLSKNLINYSTYMPHTKIKLFEIFESCYFGFYFSYYLAILNEVDPHPIPWVDYFKAKLSK